MGIWIFIIASIPATIAMTGFSYAVSKVFRRLFKEPVLLEYLAIKGESASHFVGWMLHFSIGVAFAACYYLLHLFNLLDVGLVSYLVLSALSGIAGILGWMVMFAVSGRQIDIDKKAFFAQLFFAHVIFTMVVYGILILYGYSN